MSSFPITVQIRTPLPVPVDRFDFLRKLVNDTKEAHGIHADTPAAYMGQDDHDLVITFFYEVASDGR